MKRMIFRGISVLYNNTIYGDLRHKYGCPCIDNSYCDYDESYSRGIIEVSPDTVSIDTLRQDKHGKKIFTGDIVKVTKNGGNYPDIITLAVVVYDETISSFVPLNTPFDEVEIVGNIWHNPELVEEIYGKQ